ncbi:MAG: thioredoxin family protein [Nitrososphaeria archaeon]
MQIEVECISEDELQSFVESNDIVVMDFWAPWCAPCHVMHRILQGLMPAFPHVKFGRIDTQKYPDVSDRFSVYGLPTLIIFRNGEPVDRIVGVVPKELLASRIRALVGDKQ